MSFVSTGFQALNSMIAGNSECRGFPRGGFTILNGESGSGKSQLLKTCCSRAHRNGLKVVYITSEDRFQSEYPVVEVNTLDEVTRLMATLLHPGKNDKTDLLVIDCLTQLWATDSTLLANHARELGAMFRREFGQTAVVGTVQSRRVGGALSSVAGSTGVAFVASIILGITKEDTGYRLDLFKSRFSFAGVSCLILPTDMDDFDRSTIPTRYQRILRGRN